jgi:HEAT repeat protein
MGRAIVKPRAMTRVSAAVLCLLAASGCRSGPSEEHKAADLFDRIAVLRARLNRAYATLELPRIRPEAVELTALVQANYEKVVAALSSEDRPRRMDATFALGFSDNRAAIEPLVAASSAADWEVRFNAIAALGILAYDEVPTDPFRRLLQDESPRVRHAALFGLRHLLAAESDRGMLEAIHARLGDPVMDVRNEALIVLQKLRRRESVGPIVSRSLKDPEWMVRSNAARALGAIGKDAAPATPHVIEMLRDEDTGVVEWAWKALNLVHEKDFDRSYHTWRDWYEDEQRHHYACIEHKEVASDRPGDCPSCRRKLERLPRDTGKRPEPGPTVYVCPDHAEVQTASPARCGKAGCQKELLPRKMDLTYACPEHPEVATSTPSRCGKPGCGKELLPKK